MNQIPDGPRLRPRFKGIENFLRTIAFNLGNTPSQTEVKVISCVPIDVTDLQNKIVELEKLLDMRSTARTIAPALGTPVFKPLQLLQTQEAPTNNNPDANAGVSPDNSGSINAGPSRSRDDTRLHTKQRPKLKKSNHKENIQMVYFSHASPNASPFRKEKEKAVERRRKAERSKNETSALIPEITPSYVEDIVRRQYEPSVPTSSRFSWPVCRDDPGTGALAPFESDVCSCCCNGFQDLDTSDTQPAQCPQRECSRYYDSSMYDLVPVRDTPIRIIDVREEDVYRRDPGKKAMRLQHDCSPGRNTRSSAAKPPAQTVMYAATSPPRVGHKFRNKFRMPTKATFKRDQVLKTMQFRRIEPRLGTEASRTSCVECGHLYAKVVPRVASRQRSLTHANSPLPPPTPLPPPPAPHRSALFKNAECLTSNMQDSVCQTATSRSVQLDIASTACIKPDNTEITLNQIKSILHAVLTEVKTNAQKAANTMTKDAVVQNGPSNGNVLTNASCPPTDVSTRPTDVSTNQQSDSDRINMMTSYVHSPYTINPYSPFTGNPCYPVEGAAAVGGGAGASMLPAIPTGPYGPPKGLQQYPLFIQAPARCTCCYRSIPQRVPSTTPPPPPPPARRPSDTVDISRQSRNRETEKLVKEIYKSLYMDYAQKTVSSKSQAVAVTPTFKFAKLPKGSKSEAPPAKMLNIKRKTETSEDTVVSQGSDDLTLSHLPEEGSHDTESSTPSDVPTAKGYTTTDTNYTRAMIPNFLTEPQEPYEPPVLTLGTTPPEEETLEDEESVSATSETSGYTIKPRSPQVLEKQKKAGLFSKMKKLFTSKNRRGQRSAALSAKTQNQSSDDDYETVQSDDQGYDDQRSRTTDRRRFVQSARHERYSPAAPTQRRTRPHSKDYRHYQSKPPSSSYRSSGSPRYPTGGKTRYSERMPERARRPPPYWQESRRYFNKPPSMGGRARPTDRHSSRQRPRPPYWQEYEARPLLTAARRDLPDLHYRHHERQEIDPRLRDRQATEHPDSPDTFKGKGLSWFKKALPTLPQINIPHCGVQWKDFVMNN